MHEAMRVNLTDQKIFEIILTQNVCIINNLKSKYICTSMHDGYDHVYIRGEERVWVWLIIIILLS